MKGSATPQLLDFWNDIAAEGLGNQESSEKPADQLSPLKPEPVPAVIQKAPASNGGKQDLYKPLKHREGYGQMLP